MIEIPESLTIAGQLNDTVRGKRIAEVEAEHTKHSFAWYAGEPQEYAGKMVGKTVGASHGIGSMVEVELEDYRFTVGEGINIRYFEPGEKLPEKYQMRIIFEDDSSLICSVQMYGAMFLFKPEEYDNFYYLVAKEKPMPGTEGFDYPYFKSLKEDLNGNLSAKAMLATEQRIPGLGNGVLQDILLEAGIHPKRKIGSLREDDWKHLFEAVVNTLWQMTEKGGRDTEKNLFGQTGGYHTKLSKKTLGKPCVYCASPIQKASYLGGTIYFCAQCQKI
ncbi:MAG: endonuclease VIII [Clostridiales bacterium]|nr:endonuclease VIII [Clostridiales bacterium]